MTRTQEFMNSDPVTVEGNLPLANKLRILTKVQSSALPSQQSVSAGGYAMTPVFRAGPKQG